MELSATGGSLSSHLMLRPGDAFGSALAGGGDWSGDGVPDIAVGAPGRRAVSGVGSGAAYLFVLAGVVPQGRADATLPLGGLVAAAAGGLSDGDNLGESVALIGDVDGDGVGDVVVGAPTDDDGGSSRGAIWIMFMKAAEDGAGACGA